MIQELKERVFKRVADGTLAWRIPWTEEPGGLLSMGPQRARHN